MPTLVDEVCDGLGREEGDETMESPRIGLPV
jgi:hypothetical protein